MRATVLALTEQEALQRVLEDAEHDQPRLDYAATVGGDRAASIIDEIKARDGRRRGYRSAQELYGRAMRAVRTHPEWLEPVRGMVDHVHFGRGFVEGVTTTLAAFRSLSPRLFELAPILHLQITDAHGRCAELAALPDLARIRSLDVSRCRLVDDDVRALVSSPHLRALRWLSLAQNEITSDGFTALAEAATNLPGLRHAELAINVGSCPTDEMIEDDGGVIRWSPSEAGLLLEQAHGPLPWLHAQHHSTARDLYYET